MTDPTTTPPNDDTGQTIQESPGYQRVVVPHRKHSGQLESEDLESIRARNVTMNQSGADQIDAETVSMTNAGATAVNAQTVDMTQSGSVKIDAQRVAMQESSALGIFAEKAELTASNALMVNAGTATIGGGNRMGVLATGTMEASGDVKAIVAFAGNISAQRDVNVLFDAKAAAALGAGFALVITVLRKRVGRK